MSTGAGAQVDNRTGECGCIETANPGSQMEMSYVFDDNRNLLSVTAPNAPWLNQSFSYDSHNRLTHARGRYGNMSYTYDKTGNRQSRTMNTRQEAYSYAPGTNRIQEITGYNPTTFTLDAAGNITTMGDKTLVYNQRHRLIRVEQGAEVLGEYTYNGLEQRAIKEVNGVKTIFLYNHNNRLIAEADESGNITTEYLYRGKILMAKTDPATGSLYFYLNARLSTPVMMTDESNTLVWEAMYRPFGEATVNPHSTVVNNLRFPGQYYDEETGLHYNYHRYYDPRTGRYLRPDPIGLEGGINLFTYVSNNPVNKTDPKGLWSVRISFYKGYGGSVVFGTEGGKSFVIAGGGVGLGGGISYDPMGGFPRGDREIALSPEAFIGPTAGIGGVVGPLALGVEGYAGGSIDQDCEEELHIDYIEGINPYGSISGARGLGLRAEGYINLINVGIAW